MEELISHPGGKRLQNMTTMENHDVSWENSLVRWPLSKAIPGGDSPNVRIGGPVALVMWKTDMKKLRAKTTWRWVNVWAQLPTSREYSNVINHPCLMGFATHLWWLGAWFIIAIPTLFPYQFCVTLHQLKKISMCLSSATLVHGLLESIPPQSDAGRWFPQVKNAHWIRVSLFRDKG